MNFSGWLARFRRLQDEHATWKLLHADNAPVILAFIADLFAEENEVPFARARIALDAELSRGRELGYWQSESGAGIYLNQWIRAGWLREMDDMLSKTDAGETALRFCRALDEPAAGTSASHLRIVQDAVREFAVAVNPDVDARIAQLEQRRQEIQRNIDEMRAGVSVELSEAEQRERIREIYQLASVLTGDFRRVEDDIRRLDKDLRIQIIEGDSTRGDVLLELMEKEVLLANTDAGSAFEGFFQLLCDQNRSTEFSDQLRAILSLPVAQHLNSSQRQFLAQLMRELSRESERVFSIRRRTDDRSKHSCLLHPCCTRRSTADLCSALRPLSAGKTALSTAQRRGSGGDVQRAYRAAASPVSLLALLSRASIADRIHIVTWSADCRLPMSPFYGRYQTTTRSGCGKIILSGRPEPTAPARQADNTGDCDATAE